MKIELSMCLALDLAKACAKEIHGRVVQMHLKASWGIHPSDAGECPYKPFRGDSYQEVQAAIRSIQDPLERRLFIGMVQGYFLELRAEKGTEPKWQDYVASVKAHAASLRGSTPLTLGLSPL